MLLAEQLFTRIFIISIFLYFSDSFYLVRTVTLIKTETLAKKNLGKKK